MTKVRMSGSGGPRRTLMSSLAARVNSTSVSSGRPRALREGGSLPARAAARRCASLASRWPRRRPHRLGGTQCLLFARAASASKAGRSQYRFGPCFQLIVRRIADPFTYGCGKRTETQPHLPKDDARGPRPAFRSVFRSTLFHPGFRDCTHQRLPSVRFRALQRRLQHRRRQVQPLGEERRIYSRPCRNRAERPR